MHRQVAARLVAGAVVMAVGMAPITTLAQTPGVDGGPMQLAREVVVRQDGLELTLELERNPLVAGVSTTVRTRIENVGRNDVIWAHGGCVNAAFAQGMMDEASWREGGPVPPGAPTDFARFTKRSRIDGGPEIRLGLVPRAAVRKSGTGCSDAQRVTRIAPGQKLNDRFIWDGFASPELGLPPAGPATISASFGRYKRQGQKGQPRSTIAAEVEALILSNVDDAALHPMEVIDAAVADPSFTAMMSDIRVGDGNTPILWFDDEAGLWEVGVLDNFSESLTLGLVDPTSGQVRALVERQWIPGDDPNPSFD